MEQMNLKRTDLAKYIGSRGRVSEILNRQRKLTLAMIKRLHHDFGIPAESLLA
jgi:HTH-type transcriptional regulator/antitoxin HigA